MKKVLTLLLAVSMLLTTLPTAAMTAGNSVVTEQITTAAEGECGENLAWLLQDKGVLVISGTGPMADYRNQSAPWEEAAGEANIAIKQVVFEEGVTEISNYAFAWRYDIEYVSFSSTVSAIYDSTFVSCGSLKAFEVHADNPYFSVDGNGVLYDKNKTVVKQYPAGNTDSIYTLPASVNEISRRSFTGAVNLNAISVENGSTSFSSVDGVLFDYSRSKLIIYPAARENSSYAVPDGVAAIGEFAFEGADNLQTIELPDTLVSIEHFAFGECFGLTEIVLPDSVTSVESQAFTGCTSLSEVTLSAKMTSIPSEMFAWCESLTEVEIPDGVEEIGYYAFGRCQNLETIYIPETVEWIEEEAFSECEQLTIYGYADSFAQDYAEENNIPFRVMGQGGVDGGSGNQGGTSSVQGYYTLAAEYDEDLCKVSMIDPDTSVVIDNGKIAYGKNGEATVNVVASSTNGTTVKALYVNDVKWTGAMTSGNMDTWFEGVVIRENSIIRVEAERILPVRISFPDTAYLNGSITCSIEVTGCNTGKVTSNRFVKKNLASTTYNIDLSDNSDSSYYVSFYVMNPENADTNVSVYTTYYYRHTGYENLTKFYGSKQPVYMQNNSDNTISVIIPEGRLIKGKLNIPNDFYADSRAELYEVQAWFTDDEGNYVDYAIGTVDSQYNYSIPVPDALTGTYTISIRPEFRNKDAAPEDNNTSTSGISRYYPRTNLVLKAYDYVDADGNNVYFEIPATEGVRNINIDLETGYVVSGTLEIPEDAVIGEDAYVWMSVSGFDADSSEFVDGEGDYYFEIDYKEGKAAYEYYFAISKKTRKLILSAFASVHGSSSDLVCNVVNNNAYYVSDGVMTASLENAARLSITQDTSDIKLQLMTGIPTALTMSKPNGEYESLYYDVDLYSAAGEAVSNSSYSMSYYSNSFTETLVVPKGYSEVYVSYDIDEDYSNTTLYTDRVYVNPDGTYSTDIEDASPWKIADGCEIDIVFATSESVNSSLGNTVFNVADTATQKEISGASVTVTDASGITVKKSTNSKGKAAVNLEDGTYYVTAIADGYKARSFKIERSDSNNDFTVYLSEDDIIKVTSAVKEMTLDEMKEAGIDTDAIGNKQVYNCTAVLSFIPDFSINYCYDSDGGIVKGGTFVHNNIAVTPVGKDIYLIVKSTTSWLKETFEVQIVCDNTSASETVEDLVANLCVPEGLSLAIMAEGEQNAAASLGDVAPKGTASHKWYICGDAAGEYTLDGTLTGTRTGGGISEDINLTFGIADSITILAGNAMTLTIDAETRGIVGEPYHMRYTLENTSDKTLYNLSFSVLGGKFFEDYGVTEAKYAKEYGPDAAEDLNGKGFLFETQEFKPGDKIAGLFEITFGEELLLGEGQEWRLKDAFVVTGAGSTTVIPTTINWLPDVPRHNWDGGTVTKEPTCTEHGIITYTCKDAECGETYTDRISATGHKMSGFVTVNPTCTQEGSETSSCQNEGCNHTVVLPLAKTEHSWNTEYTTDTQPTCTEKGSKSIHCANCSASKDAQDIASTGHSYPDWQVRTPATCEGKGEEYRICLNGCGNEETKTIDALGHNWDDGTVTKNPTETETGNKLYSCKRCTATKNETLPMLVRQQLEFARVGDIAVTYGQFRYVDNMAYNDSENGSTLVYTSSNTDVATVDENGRATIAKAGETIIIATAAATDIYSETSISYKLTVNKAALTIAPADVEIFYGDVPQLKEYSASGYVFEEDSSVLTGEAVYSTEYVRYGRVGAYKTSVCGLMAENYDIKFTDGTLTVKKAEDYTIDIANLSQRKGSTEAVVTAITPKDASAVIKVEYKIAEDTWSDAVPAEIGDYIVRAYLVSADNIVPKADYYAEAVLSVRAGAMIDLSGNGGLSIDTQVDGDKVEFNITDENVETIINNIPSNGEVVIDAKGSTNGVKELTLPSNIINALDESDNAKSLTILADDAEITMDTKVLETVAGKTSATDKISIHIDAVQKEELNQKQQEALDTIGGDNAVILQLNLVVTSYENGESTDEAVHQLNGKVDVRAAYTLPADMEGKRVLVCYVADDGSVSYVRAKYDNGFVSFTTNHFSHYALVAIPCPHQWDSGTVITEATTASTGIKRYTCALCDETKDEVIPRKSSGNGGGGGASSVCTVTYQTNGGSEIKKSSVDKNTVLSQPEAPKKEGFEFGGWYTDKELTKPYDFSAKVTKNITLYAKWNEIEKPVSDEPQAATVFTDVRETDWFCESVRYVTQSKLMNGIAEGKFAPYDTLTRAMLVTVLYRHAGEPAVNRSIPFADTDMSAYYANAVLWAKQNGIVNGVTENEFAPDSNITREQIATIIFRYAQYNGMDTVTLEENLGFQDRGEISEYAASAMNWAVGKGLMKGKSAETINPKDNASRAEIAAILQRFIEADK